jgi:hypothetical protein
MSPIIYRYGHLPLTAVLPVVGSELGDTHMLGLTIASITRDDHEELPIQFPNILNH